MTAADLASSMTCRRPKALFGMQGPDTWEVKRQRRQLVRPQLGLMHLKSGTTSIDGYLAQRDKMDSEPSPQAGRFANSPQLQGGPLR